MKKYLLIFLIAAGCGSDDSPKPQTKYEIAAEFQDYVNTFYTEAEGRVHGTFEHSNLIVRELTPGYQLPDGSHPVSRYYKEGEQRIIEVLELAPTNCQELPVLREMAHVFMDKPYEADTETIMDPDVNPCVYVHTGSGEFYPFREEYLTELFAN